MKRILALFLAAAMLLLAACGDNGASSSVDSAVSDETVSTAESDVDSSATASKSVVPEVNDYSEHTYNVTEITEYLKLDGRYAVTDTGAELGSEKCISFDNTAQMIAFNADCEGDVIINMTLKVGVEERRRSHYYTVYVDGVEQERASVAGLPGVTSKQRMTVATGLKKGEHSFKIYRQSELLHGIENIVSITMHGVPTARPADSELYIEFLGDSITAGYGDLTVTSDNDDPSGTAKSDGTQTYAFLAAQKLGADLSVVARSGLSFSYDDIEKYWRNVSFSRDNLGKYGFERKPDVVVINLGTNDHNNYEKKGLSLDDVEKKAEELLKMVREDCPDSKIVWMYGMMGSNISEQIKTAIANAGGADSGIYYLQGEQNFEGGGWHPSVSGHKDNAKILADFIKTIL